VPEFFVRILLATDHYPPFIGGAQIQTRLIARELHARGHDVLIATVWQNDVLDAEDDDGVPLHRLRQLRTLPLVARKRRQHHQPPFPDPVTVAGLRRLIARFRPDVVHSYGWFSYSCAAALLGTDIPLLITGRDYAYSCAKRTLVYDGRACTGPALGKCLGCAGEYYGRPKGWVAALGVLATAPLLRRKVAAIHSISTYVQAMIRRDFLDDRKAGARATGELIHDVIGSVREEEYGSGESCEIGPYLEQLPAEPFLLFVGALRRVKGVEQLLAAYERLNDPPPLVLIGTIERDSPSAFPSSARVLTDFPHAAVMAAWERCIFGVLPSLWPEPFGTVVCEAMSRGKAVIGTTPGGHVDMIVNGETGFLVPAGDVAALATAMQRLISDPDLRERFGAAGRVRAQLFTSEVAIPRLERLYEQLVRRPRAAQS
jgi:glycosyltransferase involved in cell wall biosynthesis